MIHHFSKEAIFKTLVKKSLHLEISDHRSLYNFKTKKGCIYIKTVSLPEGGFLDQMIWAYIY